MNIQKKSFGLDIRLGLAIIVLILLVLLFATNYTIYRVKNTLKSQLVEELYSAAVVTSYQLSQQNDISLQDSIFNKVEYEYHLNKILTIHLDYKRATNIQMGYPLDSQFTSVVDDFNILELKPILKNEYIFKHELGDPSGLLLYPTEVAGSKYLLLLEKENNLLSSVEKAGSLLVYFAIIGTIIIVYGTVKFAKRVISPFENLKQKALKSGHLSDSKNDDVEQLILSYERIINDLKESELELGKLNQIVSERADHLEVYNNYILNSVNTGIITLDIERKISTFNPAVGKIFNFDHFNVIGNGYSVMSRYPEFHDFINRFFDAEEDIENEKLEITSNQQSRIISASMAPLYDKDNLKIGYLIIILDQTDFINLERELELKERMAVLGEMSGGLAHQLRNSMGGIIGFARLIEKKTENEKARKNIEALIRETGEAENLVSRFLDYARPLEPQTTIVDIHNLIDNLIDPIAKQNPNIEITVDFDSTLTNVNLDTLLMKQALGNIIINAINSIEHDHGKVSVFSANVEGNLQIRIQDNGSGIPKNYHDKIFTPFFSGNPAGTGLGLPLVRKIILLHDGRIEFETNSSGTTFIITLPAIVAVERVGKKQAMPVP